MRIGKVAWISKNGIIHENQYVVFSDCIDDILDYGNVWPRYCGEIEESDHGKRYLPPQMGIGS